MYFFLSVKIKLIFKISHHLYSGLYDLKDIFQSESIFFAFIKSRSNLKKKSD